MPQFVILDHDHPFPHFDLMLESAGRLRTWRLRGEPTRQTPIAAEALGDHRLDYLQYEGPVSGGRGRVVRWDAGEFEWIRADDDEIVIELDGERCRGRAALSCAAGVWTWRYGGVD